jgi:class 3 adenylate cyclase
MGEIRDFRLNRSGNPPRQSAPRRLAAIVAGDISGYSRLVQIDEEGTHGRVKRIERELIGPSILEHHGRLVKTTGDRFIAIFDSPVAAARCGILTRQSMVERTHRCPSITGSSIGLVSILATLSPTTFMATASTLPHVLRLLPGLTKFASRAACTN